MVTPGRPLPANNDPASNRASDCYVFDEFQLFPTSRVLTRNNESIPLGGRALDLLVALVERAGQVVSKTELFDLVWPSQVIEESNLRVNIAAVRKALGDGRSGARFIVSVPGRGYSFVTEVVRSPYPEPKTGQQKAVAAASLGHAGFPAALTRIFGRDEVIAEIADQLPRRRLVTITGTGGIGKTAVALAVVLLLQTDIATASSSSTLPLWHSRICLPPILHPCCGCLLVTKASHCRKF
jgi:DNA-binding winged helix-turn-helix (wHTH) protein